jgi:hypothetical protein
MRLAAMWAAGAMMLAHSEAFLAPGGSVGWATRANRASVSMMATLEPGSTCLVLGSGPLHLLTAKQAALAGYQTCVFTAQEPSDAIELIYDGTSLKPLSDPRPSKYIYNMYIFASYPLAADCCCCCCCCCLLLLMTADCSTARRFGQRLCHRYCLPEGLPASDLPRHFQQGKVRRGDPERRVDFARDRR